MNTTTHDTTTPAGPEQSWRALADRLTLEQFRHLAAIERLALANADNPAQRDTAAETLDGLAEEARFYADANPTPGLDDPRGQLRTALAAVNPAELSREDVMAVIDLIRKAMEAKRVR